MEQELKGMLTGYKVFNHDWTCRDFHYKVGQTYEQPGNPRMCSYGFHFCGELNSCFSYYAFDPDNKVAEVVAFGPILTDGDKYCTNKITIVRELTWWDVLHLVNKGKGNVGIRNDGDHNTGNENKGNCNTGSKNVSNHNSGNGNYGPRNTGDNNSGRFNTGDDNTGDHNTGNFNAGSRNTGNFNLGNRNISDKNIGSRNTGDRNVGDENTGDYNIGHHNTGNYNWGSRNCGDFNQSCYNYGCFSTEDHKTLTFFDKPSHWTFARWRGSVQYDLLSRVKIEASIDWVPLSMMTDEEKANHPGCTGGYLRLSENYNNFKDWWKDLNAFQKEAIKEIPNFDAEKFFEITKIDVTEDKRYERAENEERNGF